MANAIKVIYISWTKLINLGSLFRLFAFITCLIIQLIIHHFLPGSFLVGEDPQNDAGAMDRPAFYTDSVPCRSNQDGTG